MKRSFFFVLILASGLLLRSAAQTLPAPAESTVSGTTAGSAKIAVVAFQAAVAQTNEGQRNFADLQKKYGPRESQVKALNDEVESLTKQLQSQGETLSEAERASRAKTLDEKKKKLDRASEDLKTDGNQEIQEMYNTLASKVFEVLSSYAQQHGYTVVLDISQQQTPVLYASPSLDITKAVVEAYNLKSGVPAPPSAATTKPPSGR